MTHEYRLVVIDSDSEKTELAGRFLPQDWRLLQDYLRAVYELLETRYVKKGMPASLHVSWQREAGLTITPTLPDWEEVMVFLHRFRPVGLQSEPVYFFKVVNLLGRKLAHPQIRSLLGGLREQFSGYVGYTFHINDAVVTSEDVLHKWLNAYEYHRDRDKQEFIGDLHRSFPLDATKTMFLNMLHQKMIAVRNLAAIIRVVVGEQERLEGKIHLERKDYFSHGS